MLFSMQLSVLPSMLAPSQGAPRRGGGFGKEAAGGVAGAGAGAGAGGGSTGDAAAGAGGGTGGGSFEYG